MYFRTRELLPDALLYIGPIGHIPTKTHNGATHTWSRRTTRSGAWRCPRGQSACTPPSPASPPRTGSLDTCSPSTASASSTWWRIWPRNCPGYQRRRWRRRGRYRWSWVCWATAEAFRWSFSHSHFRPRDCTARSSRAR